MQVGEKFGLKTYYEKKIGKRYLGHKDAGLKKKIGKNKFCSKIMLVKEYFDSKYFIKKILVQ